ncbi:MAG: hypothetical protein QG673_899 [Pseudomonadota bacterium]|nr:hypothetical protein [Pseudomonadota bacterium]
MMVQTVVRCKLKYLLAGNLQGIKLKLEMVTYKIRYFKQKIDVYSIIVFSETIDNHRLFDNYLVLI